MVIVLAEWYKDVPVTDVKPASMLSMWLLDARDTFGAEERRTCWLKPLSMKASMLFVFVAVVVVSHQSRRARHKQVDGTRRGRGPTRRNELSKRASW